MKTIKELEEIEEEQGETYSIDGYRLALKDILELIDEIIKPIKEEKILFEEHGSCREGFRIEYLRLQIKVLEELKARIEGK